MSKGITEGAKLDGKLRLLGKKALERRKVLKWSYVNIISHNAGWLKPDMSSMALMAILENIFLHFLYEQLHGNQI